MMEMLGPDYSMKATADLLLMKHDERPPHRADRLARQAAGGLHRNGRRPPTGRSAREGVDRRRPHPRPPDARGLLAIHADPQGGARLQSSANGSRYRPCDLATPEVGSVQRGHSAERNGTSNSPAKLRDELPGILGVGRSRLSRLAAAWTGRAQGDHRRHGRLPERRGRAVELHHRVLRHRRPRPRSRPPTCWTPTRNGAATST